MRRPWEARRVLPRRSVPRQRYCLKEEHSGFSRSQGENPEGPEDMKSVPSPMWVELIQLNHAPYTLTQSHRSALSVISTSFLGKFLMPPSSPLRPRNLEGVDSGPLCQDPSLSSQHPRLEQCGNQSNLLPFPGTPPAPRKRLVPSGLPRMLTDIVFSGSPP